MAGPTGFRRLFSLLAAAALAVPPGALAAQATDPGSAASSERVDLLSWAAGAFVVRADPAAVEGARAALDGDDRTVSIGIPRRQPLPHVFVVELPAVTTFETFGVPEVGEFGPARGRHIGTIRIEGSTEGPETGFVPLATLEVQVDQGAPQHFPVAEARPARWIRVRFETRILPPPTDVDPFTFRRARGLRSPGADRDTGRPLHRQLAAPAEPASTTCRASTCSCSPRTAPNSGDARSGEGSG
jgi:hypothetical protein